MKKRKKNSINITYSAMRKIENLLKNKDKKNLKFRIYIVGGGCNGFQYEFSLDDKVSKQDLIIKQTRDISVIVDPFSFQYLIGGSIDYEEELDGSRFLVYNPNARNTCSCGKSFGI